jgi:transposase
MRDKDLYQQILGIASPWRVTDVELDLKEEAVTVRVALEPGAQLLCPECGQPSPGYDRRERRWRHLDTCQFQTILAAEVPRVQCPTHGVHQVGVPWAEAGSGFTALFEALVIDWLREASIAAVARRMQLSWSGIDTIMRRAVARGLQRRQAESPRHLNIDETSFRKGHNYVTVVSDSDSGRVLHVAEERTTQSLKGYYSTLNEEQKEALESVAMDMWPAYITATVAAVPEARRKIAFDKFHVAKHLGEAVDRVRRGEHRALSEQGDDTLKGSKYLWLWNPDNMSAEKWRGFKALRESTLKTARAWSIKETAMGLWHYVSRTWAENAWRAWLAWAQRSRLEPVRKVARMIGEHLWGIINAVVLKVDNGGAESINSRIQMIKIRARGFRNKLRFQQAIYFYLGGLKLYPDAILNPLTHTDQ